MTQKRLICCKTKPTSLLHKKISGLSLKPFVHAIIALKFCPMQKFFEETNKMKIGGGRADLNCKEDVAGVPTHTL